MALLLTRASRLARWLLGWARSIVIALAAWFVLSTFLVQAFRITSGSMEGTVLVGDFLFVNKLLYGAEVPLARRHLPAVREPRHDEVVVVQSPIEDLVLLKRVVGLPGDTLAMQDGRLWRNGAPIPEPYITLHRIPPNVDPETVARMLRWQAGHLVAPVAPGYEPDQRNWGPLVVPPESLFALGDNRDESLDSRFYGFIPRNNLRGAPMLIYYSYDRTSWRPAPYLTAIRWHRLFRAPFRAP
ncbi:MAG: signal peptidase I [Gemmatimonadales bacterium]